MRLVRNLLLFIISLYIGLILFMPKENLYFFLEKKLRREGVVITNEEIKSDIVKLNIAHPSIYYQGVDVAQIKSIEILPLGFVNRVEIKSLEFLDMIKDKIGTNIDDITLNHSVVKPMWVEVYISGDFGVATGYIDLENRIFHIDIIEEKNIKLLKRFLRKNGQGWFYEQRF